MKSKIRFSFARFTDSELETKASFILQSMTGNPNFTTPLPTLPDLQLSLTSYSTALVNAKDRSSLNVAEKNQARYILEAQMGQLGLYVMNVANGDDVILTSSGYTPAKMREPVIIPNPGQVTLSNGKSSGELNSAVKAVPGAKSYSHQITPDPITPASIWKNVISSRSKNTFKGLLPGKQYWVRVEAVGAQNQTSLSPASSIFVQ